jgi:AMP-binding enzyme
MNWTDVIFFHAVVTPEKLAIVSHGAVCQYGRLAHGILSTQRRLVAAGLVQGQTAAINVAHPIDHFIVACALYRIKVTSASIGHAPDAYLDAVPFDVVITAKLLLVDTSWFKDEVTSDLTERTGAVGDSDWTCRVNCFPDDRRLPRVVKTSARKFEAQIVTYCVSAFSDWDRMISVAPLHTQAGLLLGATAVWHGRTVLFADPASTRSLTSLHQYHYLVGTTQGIEPILNMQATEYASMRPLRGAWIEGQRFTPAFIEKCLTTVSVNTILSYSHPQIGIVTFGNAARIKDVTGAAGFVAPWVEVQVVDDGGTPLSRETDGELRFRARDGSAGIGAEPSGSPDGEWIHPGQRARLSRNNLLVLS